MQTVPFLSSLLRRFLIIGMLLLQPGLREAAGGGTRQGQEALRTAFGPREGCFVFTDCATGETIRQEPAMAARPFPPCSTFKIWNAAIGLEEGILSRADEPFYQWDGVKRFIPEWNRDLTLREAFAASCVPAFQQLARKIGEPAMKRWIEKLGYGDGNTAAGLDVFWLPGEGRKPILISPDAQVALLRRLLAGELPFSRHTRTVLKEIMRVSEGEHGTLYGKTGTGGDGKERVGWFVGYVESGQKTFAFAALLRGPEITGRDARAVAEEFLRKEGLL